MTALHRLLTQMEQYDGVLVMATNHMQVVDSAALRRFDFKICFSSLRPQQAPDFSQNCLGIPPISRFETQPSRPGSLSWGLHDCPAPPDSAWSTTNQSDAD